MPKKITATSACNEEELDEDDRKPAAKENPHTPIASVKRPRSSLDRSMLSPTKGSGTSTSLPSTPLNGTTTTACASTPSTIKEGIHEEDAIRDQLPMSPMHPARPFVIREDEPAVQEAEHALALAKGEHGDENGNDPHNNSGGSWVGRQVDALFSPVLNFLNGEEHEEHEGHAGEEGHGHVVHHHRTHNKHPQDDIPMDDTSTTAVDTTDTVLEIPRKMESDTSNTTTSLETTASHEEEEEEEEPEAEPEPQEEEEEPVIDDDGSSQGSLDEDEFNPYVFIKSLPAYDLVAPLRPPIALPPKRKDAPLISLVLDLDETLVHCTVEPVDDADLVFPVVFHGMTYQVHVRLRPHLFQFLEKIHGQYEVTVFTASQKVYANELLDLIDPGT
jgi:hypothetical protein